MRLIMVSGRFILSCIPFLIYGTIDFDFSLYPPINAVPPKRFVFFLFLGAPVRPIPELPLRGPEGGVSSCL